MPYNIAVVDAGGALIAHARMDNAWLGSIDIAINKAWTAGAFDNSHDRSRQNHPRAVRQGFRPELPPIIPRW